MVRTPPNDTRTRSDASKQRKGIISVLTAFCIIALIGFVAMGVDIGYVAYQKQKMQISADAAALAAAMEITNAVEQAPDDVSDVTAYALTEAREMARLVMDHNGHYIDKDVDVTFGRRTYDENADEFTIEWGASPANVVKVACRKDNDDSSAPDARIPYFFGGILGNSSPDLNVESIATVESRDIVSVLDFSRSMNFDSYFTWEAEQLLSQSQIEDNIAKVWEDLGSPMYGDMTYAPDWVTIPSAYWGDDLTIRWESDQVYIDCASNLTYVRLYFGNSYQNFYPNSNSGTWKGTGYYNGSRVTKVKVRRWNNSWETFDFYNNSTIRRGLGLDNVSYPFEQGSWNEYISMARDTSGSYYDYRIYSNGYRRKFGMLTFMHYILRFNAGHDETSALWKTRHYPFHSLKEGQELLCDYLNDLGFNDYVGMVSYDTSHRVEMTQSASGEIPAVDLSNEPITNDYTSMKDLIHYKQAAHYSYSTNMGGGLKDAKWLLENHSRAGARGTILLITDGNANTIDSNDVTELPEDWDWDELFDYDNDGEADYSTSSTDRQYVLKKAKECVDSGYTIHTMSVGAYADTGLMQAIAHLGGGIYVEVPGNSSTEAMEEDVLDAFQRIAALVPSAKLLNPANEN